MLICTPVIDDAEARYSCACHSPAFARLNATFERRFSRRAFLGPARAAELFTAYARLRGATGVDELEGDRDLVRFAELQLAGTIGAASVFKAVYLDKRELKCACVGGNSNVPLGFVSLTENVMMVAMAIWMLAMPTLPR